MRKTLVTAIRQEWFLSVSAGTSAVFLVCGANVADALSAPPGQAMLFLVLFSVVLGSCMSVVRHADHLAIRLGEPYGTLILTLAVTIIEVMSISAMMVHGAPNPALVRDTIFAVIMILLNGMVGLSLLLGAWRHREQEYNLQGANTYLGVIIPLTVLILILPDFTMTTPGPTLSPAQETFVAMISVGLYAIFLVVQTIRHRAYFNPQDSRIEMHLVSTIAQTVTIDGKRITFAPGESIHTENSYKFTERALIELLRDSGYSAPQWFQGSDNHFAVALAYPA